MKKSEAIRAIENARHADPRLRIKANELILRGHNQGEIVRLIQDKSLTFDQIWHSFQRMEFPVPISINVLV